MQQSEEGTSEPDVAAGSDGLTVVELRVDAYKRLRAAHVRPSPTGLVPVRGRNAQGKSSLLESMLDALGAEKADMPIHVGDHGAEVVMDLGGIVIEKRWKRDAGGNAKPGIVVRDAHGNSLRGPAGVLKELRGRFADPVAFLELSAADQVKTVLHVAGLDKRLSELEVVASEHYDRRRDLGREADRLSKAAGELQSEVADLPEVPIESTDALAAELQAAKDHNAARATIRATMTDAESRGKDAAERLERLQAELEKCAEQVEAQRERWQAAAKDLKAHGEEIQTEPIVEKLREHEHALKAQGRRELAEQTMREAAEAQQRHDDVDQALEATRREIAELLTTAPFPVEGMSYDHEAKVLTIGGIPFGQASQAERLRAAAAVAMSGSPRIKVMFAREGSLLDDESRAQLAQMAEDAGWQLWLEVVDSKKEGAGVWIEDGTAEQA